MEQESELDPEELEEGVAESAEASVLEDLAEDAVDVAEVMPDTHQSPMELQLPLYFLHQLDQSVQAMSHQ